MSRLCIGDIVNISMSTSNINPSTGIKNKEMFGLIVEANDKQVGYVLIVNEENLNNKKIEHCCYQYNGKLITSCVVDLNNIYYTDDNLPYLGNITSEYERTLLLKEIEERNNKRQKPLLLI